MAKNLANAKELAFVRKESALVRPSPDMEATTGIVWDSDGCVDGCHLHYVDGVAKSQKYCPLLVVRHVVGAMVVVKDFV